MVVEGLVLTAGRGTEDAPCCLHDEVLRAGTRPRNPIGRVAVHLQGLWRRGQARCSRRVRLGCPLLDRGVARGLLHQCLVDWLVVGVATLHGWGVLDDTLDEAADVRAKLRPRHGRVGPGPVTPRERGQAVRELTALLRGAHRGVAVVLLLGRVGCGLVQQRLADRRVVWVGAAELLAIGTERVLGGGSHLGRGVLGRGVRAWRSQSLRPPWRRRGVSTFLRGPPGRRGGGGIYLVQVEVGRPYCTWLRGGTQHCNKNLVFGFCFSAEHVFLFGFVLCCGGGRLP
jgi:hypothetical protein